MIAAVGITGGAERPGAGQRHLAVRQCRPCPKGAAELR